VAIEENKAIVRRVFEEVLNQRNLGLADKYYSPEYVLHPGLPASSRGPERVKRTFSQLFEAFPDVRATIENLAAEGLITFEELQAKLAGLEDARRTAKRELDGLSERRERMAELERDRAAVLESYAEKASRGLDYFTPEDRHQTYKKLRLAVSVRPGGVLEVRGVLRDVLRGVEELAEFAKHPGVPGAEDLG
jgi:predicted SnoaL-like aldol condensation-catalyzing enzyme